MKKNILIIYLILFILILATIVFSACDKEIYTIYLDKLDGTDIEFVRFYKDDLIVLPIPSREGYIFVNWYLDEAYSIQFDINEPLTSNVKLFAKWEKNFFLMRKDSNSYTLYGYVGDDLIVNIPDIYEDLPVVKIESYTFYNNNKIKSIIIPDTIEVIERNAIVKCDSIETISIPFTGRRRNAYYDESFFGYIFENKNQSQNFNRQVYISNSPTNTYLYTYYYLPKSLKTIYFTGDVITSNSFSYFSDVTRIHISNNIKEIEQDAFHYSPKLSLYFEGNVNKDWGKELQIIDKAIYYNIKELRNNSNYEYAERHDSSIIITKYKGNSTQVSFPHTIDDMPVKEIGDYCFYSYKLVKNDRFTVLNTYDYSEDDYNITTIYISDNIERIGKYAFYNLSNLNAVTLPNTLTEIDDFAFYQCINLEEINFPDSLYKIGISALLQTRWYSNQSNGLVYAGKVAYSYIGNINGNITLANDTIGIASEAFRGQANLISIIMPQELICIGDYSFNNTGINTIQISSSVTEIGNGAFSYCNNLMSIRLPNGLTVLNDYLLYNSTSLVDIVIPSGCKSIGDYAFYNCINLKEVNMPSQLENIGNYAFYNCSELVEIDVPEKVSQIGNGVFDKCYNIININVSEKNKFYQSIDGVLFDYRITNLIYYPSSNTRTYYSIPETVTTIDPNSLKYSIYIEELVLNKDIIKLHKGLLEGCNRIAKLTIPYLGGSSDRDSNDKVLGYIFGDKYYDGSRKASQKVNNFSRDYYFPLDLKEVIITTDTVIGNGAFYNCNFLETININDEVSEILAAAFYNCSGINQIVLPKQLIIIGGSAFEKCSSLQDVYFNNKLKTIHSKAFFQCNFNDVVEIPKSIEYIGSFNFNSARAIILNTIYASEISLYLSNHLIIYVPEIGLESFNSWYSNHKYKFYSKNIIDNDGYVILDNKLIQYIGNSKDAIIPDGIISIDEDAFWNSSITSVTIPNSVTEIGDRAFQNSKVYTIIILNETPPIVYTFSFSGINTNYIIKVPSQSVDEYKSEWSFLANIIFSIE